jgi:hypothetical protein
MELHYPYGMPVGLGIAAAELQANRLILRPYYMEFIDRPLRRRRPHAQEETPPAAVPVLSFA